MFQTSLFPCTPPLPHTMVVVYCVLWKRSHAPDVYTKCANWKSICASIMNWTCFPLSDWNLVNELSDMRQSGFHILEGKAYQVKFQHLCKSVHPPNLYTRRISKSDLPHPGTFHMVGIKPSVQTPGGIHPFPWRRGPARTLNPSQSKPLCVKGSFVPDCSTGGPAPSRAGS